jgi:hypothetical protein
MVMGCVWSSLDRQLERPRADMKASEVVRNDFIIIGGFLDCLDALVFLDNLDFLDIID